MIMFNEGFHEPIQAITTDVPFVDEESGLKGHFPGFVHFLGLKSKSDLAILKMVIGG